MNETLVLPDPEPTTYFACDDEHGNLSLIVYKTGPFTGEVINGGWSGVFRDGTVTVELTGATFVAPVVWTGDRIEIFDANNNGRGDYGFAFVERALGRRG